MKKLIFQGVMLALVLSLAACTTPSKQNIETGTDDNADVIESVGTEDPSNTAETADANDNSEEYTVSLEGGIEITIGGTDEIISQLGEPISYMEAPSCVHVGFDKVYTFEGFSITTSPDADNTQYITELSLVSDTAAFESGLTIGSDASELEDMFGTDFTEEFGVRKYTLPCALASIVLDGDTISAVTISAAK